MCSVLYDEKAFIDILSEQSTAKRRYLQKSVSNLLKCSIKSRAVAWLKEKHLLFFVITFDDNSSPFVSFVDYRYWLFKDLELALTEMLQMFTPEKPLDCLHLMLIGDVQTGLCYSTMVTARAGIC